MSEAFPQSTDHDEILTQKAPDPAVPDADPDLPPELFSTAIIILAGYIDRPENHKRPTMMPREKDHLIRAITVAKKLHGYTGSRVAMTESAARLFVAFGNHPQAQHCSDSELFAYTIERIKKLGGMVAK